MGWSCSARRSWRCCHLIDIKSLVLQTPLPDLSSLTMSQFPEDALPLLRLLAIGTGLVIVLYKAWDWFRTSKALPLPPGPTTPWLRVGPRYVSPTFTSTIYLRWQTTLRVPFQFAELTEKYGPVFSFRQGPRTVCVIGRYQVRPSFFCAAKVKKKKFITHGLNQAAVDIMQKHGTELADRPLSIAAGEIMSGGKRTLLVGAGERLRKLRRRDF